MPRASCQFFDRATVAIPSWEIHCGKVALGTQHRIDEADALDQLLPIDDRHQAHARDDVADCHVDSALPPMLLLDNVVGRRSLRSQALVQPGERRHLCRVLIAKPLDQLNGERRSQWSLDASQGHFRRLGLMAAGFQQPIRQRIGLLTCCLTPHDVVGQAPQIFHEHDAQRDRNRPELTYRQRLYALVGACETMQHFWRRTGCRYGRRMPKPTRTRVDILRAALPSASAAGDRSLMEGRPGSPEPAPRPRENCRVASWPLG